MQGFNTTHHEFEITLENASEITVVPEDDETAAIPAIQYHVRRFASLLCLFMRLLPDTLPSAPVKLCDAEKTSETHRLQ